MHKFITSPLQSPKKNALLAALSKPEFDRVTKHLELVNLKLGQMISAPGQPLDHAYFPTTSIISVQTITGTGASAEATEIGNEGMLGLPLLMGGNTSPTTAVVHTAGYAYRLDHQILKAEFNYAGSLQQLLLRYIQAVMTQMIQTDACNRHHSVEQQLSRWLLLTVDRAPSENLVMTQELVANMLGVDTERVAVAASHLRDIGCINFRRGQMSVVNRERLEQCTCECYAAVKKEYLRQMSGISLLH